MKHKEIRLWIIKLKLLRIFMKSHAMKNEDFNCYANTFKIHDNFNMVVWCDIDEYEKYYIVSIRYNPYDNIFGDDIGIEICTNDISWNSLLSAVKEVINKWKDMKT